MPSEHDLKSPWLIAAWPGMGGVGISAAYYLVAKLQMHLLADFPAREFFEYENVEVKNGLIHTGRLPRSQLFLWKDPAEVRDLVVFIAEAQPAKKGDAFCRQLIDRAQRMKVERVFTFAAMATQMRPEHDSRVFAAAIDHETLARLKRLGLQVLEEGTISGLNGVLLGVAAERGLPGGCLLGEMPHLFPQFPFPKASLAVLNVFSSMADCSIDFVELEAQAFQMERRLEELLERVEKSVEKPDHQPDIAQPVEDPENEQSVSPSDERRIEKLFEEAKRDRSRAYELKQELDRLKIFPEYEDRFLDLFKEPQ